ncbi:MAG: hypothetical protein FGM32_08970 [Candidatus Kapabacteria bacterium]|nr:hypothetical protein [Candidatus Kapabacteria bacterium]
MPTFFVRLCAVFGFSGETASRPYNSVSPLQLRLAPTTASRPYNCVSPLQLHLAPTTASRPYKGVTTALVTYNPKPKTQNLSQFTFDV